MSAAVSLLQKGTAENRRRTTASDTPIWAAYLPCPAVGAAPLLSSPVDLKD